MLLLLALGAPIATVEPSAERLTELPNLSFASSPFMSPPICLHVLSEFLS